MTHATYQDVSSEGEQPLPPTVAVLLAAGKSTRMRSRLPKSLHPLCGLPVTAHVVRACREAGVERVIVVVGHEAERVRSGLIEAIPDGHLLEFAHQERPLGTGDAVRAAQSLLASWPHTVLVLAGDTPLLRPQTLRQLVETRVRTHVPAVMLTMELQNPTGYGRILRDEKGRVIGVVEERDATPEQRRCCECNSSIYAFDGSRLWEALAQLRPNNAQGEYYLTDVIGWFVQQGAPVETVALEDPKEALGINTRVELAQVAALLRARLLEDLMLSGVTVVDPMSTWIDVDVTVGQDSVIHPNTLLLRGTQVGEECVLGPFARIEGCRLGNRVQVYASWLLDSVLEDDVRVGPYAQVRPNSHLGAGVRIGNFVELKNATLGPRVQASHLSYLGDVEIGEGTNIGAGTITCNYDGYQKHRTRIGSRAFIGSHSTLVAPVEVGEGAFVAAGSVITANVPADALAIARSYQTVKEGWAADYRQRKANKGEQKNASK
ncbi:UDP-N-acetylglucosamine diphosphorylase/glucosamine-1-phosphate N-acetyltransferase [Chthonomonas calidirosea]|uniref:bifunctional UDP-N-acetylglucosamine diphosphorylase/glucosamine-1-phosphate N-acetyltransferase GlmU n=1 Tax=Chthonomonas calidirosea TaxID=454171 RepID=UPI0006DD5133|nr:bifunctional UDP-N-acetylglucosamine diphosphorylase/glucosamine-1-phosphate N-acetyltransferase GlmU [Chthonomonas calidirosea]CEK17341.1 UDP-N-acetylglucosamine diphosphorylase/glucosamine-1-phosphate N-acetyltransferase [Chthonomonas calidirosea]